MSRNKREGRYYGWCKGHHLRLDYPHKVSSWLAYRLYTERKRPSSGEKRSEKQ